MLMKTMLQAAKSGYFTSVASEISAQKGQKGIKCKRAKKKCAQKFHSEAETQKQVAKTPAVATYSALSAKNFAQNRARRG